MQTDFLDSLILEDIESPEHPSDFESGEDFAVLILRLPELRRQEVRVVSYAFLSRRGASPLGEYPGKTSSNSIQVTISISKVM